MSGNAGRGRPPGSRNKLTAETLALVADGKTPVAFALGIMNDEKRDIDLRLNARMILFSGKRYVGLTSAINDLVKSMSAAKDVGRMANTSGTARQLLTAGQYAAAGSAALAGQFHIAAGILAGPWMTARLMTSPRFIRMLAGFAKSGDRGSTAVQRFAANLGLVASQEPDIQQDLLQLQRQLLSNKALQPAA